MQHYCPFLSPIPPTDTHTDNHQVPASMLGMVWNTIGMGKKSRHLRESLKKKRQNEVPQSGIQSEGHQKNMQIKLSREIKKASWRRRGFI